ncbi:hypothetical protein K0T92_14790 [Paenibacillus oenotherae]|uniref:3-methyladenine DNA glycosylase AlkC n=1 Tax=Paenibacillus oenotherae TaxID=1435645 RepID=A0ABS7D802_9BACL|nr:hypothetical protein [Paenibacillus oenotherae]MBW7476011.1 hypothetical protein [Paenibacillus oenotherae]
MAEPLKAMYDLPFLQQFAALVHSEWEPFDRERFVQLVIGEGWEQLELKGRIRRITESLGTLLPSSYEQALDVLYAIDERCVGFPYLFFPDFVEVYGRDYWEQSMHALERFTSKSTAEFAIRPFLMTETERTMARMLAWAEHESEHVRRLASEGCRPRLPWAPALAMFKLDPSPILPLLEKLKCDPSLYVRKSVANNLNDIAKDHPGIIREVAAAWRGTHPWTDWIIRHGSRTLIRAADPQTLALFGYKNDAVSDMVAEARIEMVSEEAVIGGKSEAHYSLLLCSEEPLRLRIELGVDYVKANGSVSRKKFLMSDKTVPAGGSLQGSKRIDWKDLSTRKHYPGRHRLLLLVNGGQAAETAVMLHGEGIAKEGADSP